MAKKPEENLISEALNEAQQRAAQLQAMGFAGVKICEEIGIHPTTLSGWRKKPEYRALVNACLLDAQQAASNRLRQLALSALTTISGIMASKTASDRDRLEAAKVILGLVGMTPASAGPTDAAEIEAVDRQQEELAELWGL